MTKTSIVYGIRSRCVSSFDRWWMMDGVVVNRGWPSRAEPPRVCVGYWIGRQRVGAVKEELISLSESED